MFEKVIIFVIVAAASLMLGGIASPSVAMGEAPKDSLAIGSTLNAERQMEKIRRHPQGIRCLNYTNGHAHCAGDIEVTVLGASGNRLYVPDVLVTRQLRTAVDRHEQSIANAISGLTALTSHSDQRDDALQNEFVRLIAELPESDEFVVALASSDVFVEALTQNEAFMESLAGRLAD